MNELKRLIVTDIESGEIEIDEIVNDPDMSPSMIGHYPICTDWCEHYRKTKKEIVNFSDPVGTVVTTEKYKYEIKAAELKGTDDVQQIMEDQFNLRICKLIKSARNCFDESVNGREGSQS